MATAVRSIGYEDRLSLVEHLDELRTRLIVCAAALVVAFGFCAWQNGAILDIVNVPLEKTAFKKDGKSTDPFERQAAFQQQTKRTFLVQEKIYLRLAASAEVASIAGEYRNLARSARALANTVPPRQAKKPVTLGVGEPFTQTIKLASYAALLLALPLILYQMYAFVLPAFSPREKQVALPLMLAVPFLFVGGVLFAYYAVLPSAVDFLQNFNDDEYDILLQARDYYKFAITVLIAMGLAFQVPIGILAVTGVGIVSIAQLRRTRRYALIVIAVAAAILPGQDPVTMLLIMVPMYGLYEGSILIASLLDRRSRRAAAREEAETPEADQLPLESDDDRH
ncbi:MAG: twin-arginine translocase subunit TatC [Solirubrobacterales bacterium]|nr:twin-arginine translocase subunit TatC [Solirubrobacterales bacterium]